MRKQPLIVAASIFILLCGAFWVTHIGWDGFSLDKRLSPVLLATLAVNIFIAYYLQFYFASRASDSRSEKNILIDGLRDVLSLTRQCRDTLMSCYNVGKISPTNAKLTKAQFRQIANGLDTVETGISMSQCASLGEGCKGIKDALFSYKSAATGGNFPSKAYDAQALSYQEQTYRQLIQKMHDLVFKINRYR